jgi:coenzyme F420-0:L-glutamate ligase
VISIWAPPGVGEVRRGDDLADHLLAVTAGAALADGDVVCVTSKVVSKSEGRVVAGDRADAIVRETRRLVARRGPLSIVVNRLGLTMAAAGVDVSNVEPGHVLLLPEDPDRTSRTLRAAVAERLGANVAVLVTDTAGRAWREGQTDIAIGSAGVAVLDDLRGTADAFGRRLDVTVAAVADEIAGAADLVKGKTSGNPVAVVRGLGRLVGGGDEPGAQALQRVGATDMFRLGTAEAHAEGFTEGFAEGKQAGFVKWHAAGFAEVRAAARVAGAVRIANPYPDHTDHAPGEAP